MEIFIAILIIALIVFSYLSADKEEEQGQRKKINREIEIALSKEKFEDRMHSRGQQEINPDDWNERRDYVIDRDNGRCVKCGSQKALEAHHVVERKKDLNHSVDNLITLCISCHHKEHGREISGEKVDEINERRKNWFVSVSKRDLIKITKCRKEFTCNRCKKVISKGNQRHYMGSRISKYQYSKWNLCSSCFNMGKE